jgi:hypothetical protein
MSNRTLTDEMQVEAPVAFAVLNRKRTSKVKGTAFKVTNAEAFQAINTSPTNVANFNGGQEGQRIVILGDGQSTIVVTGNIRLRTGSTMLLAASTVYMFSFFNSLWYSHQ